MQYHKISVLLHWLMALLIVGMIISGLIFANLPDDQLQLKIKIINLHKPTGMLILFLVILRLILRLFFFKPPKLMLKGIEGGAVKVTHFLFYLLMFTLPLSGWVISSIFAKIYKVNLSFFGWFNLPLLPIKISPEGVEMAKEKMHQIGEIHEIFAYILMGLLFLHIVGGLYHGLIKKDNTLYKMRIPFVKNNLKKNSV